MAVVIMGKEFERKCMALHVFQDNRLIKVYKGSFIPCVNECMGDDGRICGDEGSSVVNQWLKYTLDNGASGR